MEVIDGLLWAREKDFKGTLQIVRGDDLLLMLPNIWCEVPSNLLNEELESWSSVVRLYNDGVFNVQLRLKNKELDRISGKRFF